MISFKISFIFSSPYRPDSACNVDLTVFLRREKSSLTISSYTLLSAIGKSGSRGSIHITVDFTAGGGEKAPGGRSKQRFARA